MPIETYTISDVQSYMLIKQLLECKRHFLFDSMHHKVTCMDCGSIRSDLLEILAGASKGELGYEEVKELLAQL